MMNQRENEAAETLALRVLEWLAGTEDLLGVFLGATGMAVSDLASAASDPETLAAVLDFVFQDDEWVMQCAEATKISPEELSRVRHFLPGGDTPVWT